MNQKHLALNKRLVKELNGLARGFNAGRYLKVENIDSLLLKRDISVEKKKRVLVKELHKSIAEAFSIDKSKFSKKSFDSMKKRLHNIRKIINKLRSINYYLETTFLQDINLLKFGKTSGARKSLRFSMLSKIKITDESPKARQKSSLGRDELEALEYTAYKLIRDAATLDKRILKEYAHKEGTMLVKEKTEVEDLGLILKKESELLEHLEAKLPPPKAATIALVKEPIFTHWAARVFALLSYLEHIYASESILFTKLKKNKAAKMRISKKISDLAKERSKLLRIMEEKSLSMKRFMMDSKLKRELHSLTTIISL